MLVSSWESLVKAFPELEKRVEEPEVGALREYLERGGILKVEKGKRGIRVVYPTRSMVEERISELKRERSFYAQELAKIRALRRSLSSVRLAFDPLYIKHHIKLLADREYREAFSKLGFTRDHFLDPKTRKIIAAFMENKEYRERVLQAIEESPVYRRRKFGTSLLELRRETRASVARRREALLRKKIAEIDREITVLTLLKRWM